MKRLLVTIAPLLAILLIGTDSAVAVTVSDYPPGSPAGGILRSRHNLGAGGWVLHTHDTTEICVFCHTPHFGNSSIAPLWNRTNSTAYTTYGTTMAGTVVDAINGATLACLSCHDGVTQFDILINAPGKGNNGGAIGATDLGWQFYMPGDVKMMGPLDHFLSSECTMCHGSGGGGMGGGGMGGNIASIEIARDRLVIGDNLANDHPVSVIYNDSLDSLRPLNTVIANIDLASELNTNDPAITQNRWAVNGFIDSGTATIRDLLRNGRVECTSCHDPHFKNLSWDEVESTWPASNWCSADPEGCSDGQFLRRVGGNAGSGICRTCHTN